MDIKERAQIIMQVVWAADEAANVCCDEPARAAYYAAHLMAHSLIGGRTPIQYGKSDIHRREAVNIATKLGGLNRTYTVQSWTFPAAQ